MSISEEAKEFAGLPVVDYVREVGLVLTSMPRREFRSADGKSVWGVALDGDRVAVDAGPGGRSRSKASPTPEYARANYRKLILRKIEEGHAERPAASSTLDAITAALRSDPDDPVSRMALADYLGEQGVQLPDAYRAAGRRFPEAGESTLDRLRSLLAEPAVGLLPALVIGVWGTSHARPDEVIEALVKAHGRLTSLRGLFLGDIPYSDNEISWIGQADLTGLLAAFPLLEHFRARGGIGLALGEMRHDHLKSLAFEASNLPRAVVRSVGMCDLPALEHLELWLGTGDYGADTIPADLAGVLSGEGLPSLRSLAIRNCEIIDGIIPALAGAPVMERLRVLDLSLGNLSDTGAEALLAIPGIAKLEKLDIRHHYVSPANVERLKALGIQVEAGDRQDDDHRYIAHSE